MNVENGPHDAVTHTVVQPDLSGMQLHAIEEGFRSLAEFGNEPPAVAKDVAQCSHLVDDRNDEDSALSKSLTDKEVLNWCRTARPLIPLSMCGHGSRLVQSISVALWGCSDAAKLLHRIVDVLFNEFSSAWKLKSRWMSQCGDHGHQADFGWDAVGQHIRQLYESSSANRLETEGLVASKSPAMADSFRLFILANALKRSIVVLSDDDSERGIYLPLEIDPADCIKYPIVIACSEGQYSPVVGYSGHVGMERAVDFVPLVTSQLEPLKIWFLLAEEESRAHELQQKYMALCEINLTRSSTNLILGAKLAYSKLGTAAASRIAVENDERTFDREVRVEGLRPTAPTFSTLSLERSGLEGLTPGRVEHEQQQELSMLPDKCVVPGCRYLASVHTHPFCHEHISHGSSSAAAVHMTEPVEPSITATRCRSSGCGYYASCFIYPYCYEHIDRKIVANTLTQPTTKSARPAPRQSELSLASINCPHHGCANVASKFVYPYCYEHIESRIAKTQAEENLTSVMEEFCAAPACGNRASLWTYPVCYEHLDYINRESKSIAKHSPVTRSVLQSHRGHQNAVPAPHPDDRSSSLGSERFMEAMAEVEARTRSTASRCKQKDCPNYGNSKSYGFCNDCFSLMQQHQLRQ